MFENFWTSGRMVIDIMKFFVIYSLVLFAFACGLNQLFWYYATMRAQECHRGEALRQREIFSNLTKAEQNLMHNLLDSCEEKYSSFAK